MADRRVSGNTVFSGPTGEVVLDLTDSTQGPLLNAGKVSAYPLVLGTDVPHDTAAGVGAVAAGAGVVSMLAGTAASKPAAGTAGRLYFATDTGEFSYDTGSAWVELNHLAGALTISNILTVGAINPTGMNGLFDIDVSNTYGVYIHRSTGTAVAFPTTGGMSTGGPVTADTLASTVATGTAPLSVASTTEVANLNSERWGGAKNDIVFQSFSSTSTTSTSYVSTGTGVAITPSTSRVLLQASGTVSVDTVGDSMDLVIYQSTVGIPAGGAAPSAGDTPLFNTEVVVHPAIANVYNPWSITYLLTGLTPGTTYYFYVAFDVSTGTGYIPSTAGGIMAESR